ncbi:MAG: DUF4270 domain-containing protein [Bacteroides sp.]|nr:DUF4270 domain-containing protein [Bacteroides sp.]
MNIRTLLLSAISLISVASFIACDDNTTTLGSSLIEDNTAVVIDSMFTISGRSMANDDVQSRTATQLLGALNAKEYGSFSSDFVAQFMPSLVLDTAGTSAADIDSVKLVMFFTTGNFTGDSIVPMGLKVYPLNRQLPSPIYSDFDPSGYYDESDCWTPNNQIYTGNALYNDSVNNLATRSVSVKLPIEFGRKFYNEFINNPSTFLTPQSFVKFFPGLYIKNTFGSGRVINFGETRINFYYKRHSTYTKEGVERDTIYHAVSSYMAVTPEVISNNLIRMTPSQSLVGRINSGEPIIVAPASYDVELKFPAVDIINRYKSNGGSMSVINTLTMSIPVEKITNGYNILPPANVLLVLSKDKKKFFADNTIPDNKTSFLATYDEENGVYEFTAMRDYILDLINKNNITADDYTFTLTPVDVTTETSSGSYYSTGSTYVTGVIPYVSGPAMCKLLLGDAKIKFTYSKQSINN